ncbi:glycerate kinase [Selenomonas sp. TAMA-11512]|uniref:glycerate kinase family protein n=1 Tax=Selenomonas sp. TAMA-11512 TaxID=3095337 RepID=UPI003084D848|nr:glycerate kinase [Selenomonas sp. TAMA-11512]
MKVTIAIDSFKGSMSSLEAGAAAERAVKRLFPEALTAVYALADGGEGTVDALVEGLHGEIVTLEVRGPLEERISGRYGWLPQTKTAVIEMADAAGLPMVPREKRNPLHTTTYGLGELILDALDRGARDFLIGIGGSATNEAGLGMLTALGAKFHDANGAEVGVTGADVARVASIDAGGMDARLKEVRFRIACDVTNPLCGDNGASAVYGPQKGATPALVEELDKALNDFADIAEEALGKSGKNLAGAGAAGGLGFAFHTFLDGELTPGIELVLDMLCIEEALKDVDILITGEGRMDHQSAMGKAPVGVAKRAKEISPKALTLAFCGAALEGARAVNEHGIDAYFPILQQVMTLEEAMKREVAEVNLEATVEQVLRVYKAK